MKKILTLISSALLFTACTHTKNISQSDQFYEIQAQIWENGSLKANMMVRTTGKEPASIKSTKKDESHEFDFKLANLGKKIFSLNANYSHSKGPSATGREMKFKGGYNTPLIIEDKKQKFVFNVRKLN